MSVRLEELMFLGTHGHVTAVRKQSGRRVWTTALPGTGYQIVTLLFEDGILFAGSRGKLFALDPTTGETLWENSLRGLGYDIMTIATTRQAVDVAALHAQIEEQNRQAASAASSPAT